MSRIQLVYANYHCAEAIERSIATLRHEDTTHPLDVVVVNNAGDPPKLGDAAAGSASTVRVDLPGRNLGYWGAMRRAMDDDRAGPYRFRVLCNPDIEFLQPDFFSRLAGLPLPQRTGVVAPSIESAITRRDQNPYLTGSPPLHVRRRWRLVYSSRWLYLLNDRLSNWRQERRRRAPVAAPSERRPIYAPHGSLIILDELFLRAERQALDAVPFLYAEELFVGEICARSGWSVQYEPSLRTRHLEHATTASLPPKGRFQLQRSAVLAYLRLVA